MLLKQSWVGCEKFPGMGLRALGEKEVSGG